MYQRRPVKYMLMHIYMKKMTKNSLYYVTLTAQLPFKGEVVEEGMHLHIYIFAK